MAARSPLGDSGGRGGPNRPGRHVGRRFPQMVRTAVDLDQRDATAPPPDGPAPARIGCTYIGAYAERLCFLRALNSQMPPHQRVVDDPFARKLLPWRWRALLPLLRFGSLEPYMVLELDRRWRGAAVYNAIRSRMIDEMLEARLRRRYDQVVVLAAGLQTRGMRSHLYPPNLRLFEVDWPEAQEEKRRRLEAGVPEALEKLHFVACDMTREGELKAALEAKGFDSQARTIFLWEGSTFALTESEVETTLRGIHASTVPGSVLILDFMDGTVLYDGRELPGSAAAQAYLTELGMPPRFGIRPGKEVAYLRRRGYRHRRTYGPSDFTIWLDTHPFYRALTIPQLWHICECIVQ